MLGRRTQEGGYCFYRTPEWGVDEPNAPDTLAAFESLRILGIAVPEPEATARWLRALQSVDGSYPTLTIGWAALSALGLLGFEPDHSPLQWLKSWTQVLLGRQASREWRGALLGTLRLLELMQLTGIELTAAQRDALVQLLAAAANGRGGRWARPGADLETTAVAIRLIGLGDLPSESEAPSEEFLRSCEDAALGLRLAPKSAAISVDALWGGVTIASMLRMPLRHPQAIRRSIGLLQHPAGGLGARDRAIPTLRDTWLGLRAACLLETPYEQTR